MKISARNVIKGTIQSIDVGAVNVEVHVEIAPDTVITSIITKKSAESLGLAKGKEAFVVIKASNVMLGTE